MKTTHSFLERLAADPALQQRLRENPGEVIREARAEGYEFNAEALSALSDEALGSLSGGGIINSQLLQNMKDLMEELSPGSGQ